MKVTPKEFLPIDIVFHPNWWNKNYGLKFTEEYFFDPERRVAQEQQMRQILYDRFGDIGLGEKNAVPKPVIGPVHLATGFLISALLGCQLRFCEGASPEALCAHMSAEQIAGLAVPDIKNTYPMNKILELAKALKEKFWYVEGDINWEGIQNVAIDLRGQELFMDYYDNPKIVRRLFDVIAETIIESTKIIRDLTNTTSISVNTIVDKVDPNINLHSNCSVQMISPETYTEYLLDYDRRLAKDMAPYGIHHCGNNMDGIASEYAKVENAVLFDVGWGSDIARCRKQLPDAILSLRFDPVQLRTFTVDEVEQHTRRMLDEAKPLEQCAFCCVNIDHGTPDENIRKMFEAVDGYRKMGS